MPRKPTQRKSKKKFTLEVYLKRKWAEATSRKRISREALKIFDKSVYHFIESMTENVLQFSEKKTNKCKTLQSRDLLYYLKIKMGDKGGSLVSAISSKTKVQTNK